MIPVIRPFPRFIVKITLDSLREDSESWVFTGYSAKNSKIGISITGITGTSALTLTTDEGYEVGGVSFWSIFFGWMTWRGRMRRAIVEAQIRRYMIKRGIRYKD